MANDAAHSIRAGATRVLPVSGATISVCVCFAAPDRIWMRPLHLNAGANVADAVEASGLAQQLPDFDLAHAPLGVFGKRVSRSRKLADGDRVEIYRALTFDPKDSRRRRAEHRLRQRHTQSGVNAPSRASP